MRFQVLVQDKPRPVQLDFGNTNDLRTVSRWRIPAALSNQPSVRDTVEFARFAAKRHRQYVRSIPAASNIRQFERIIGKNAATEIALLLVVRAEWFRRSSIIALAQCRRTFCHHLILEFLTVHPAIVGRLDPFVSGVGTGLLYGLASLAWRLGIGLVWGEATAYSSSFYAHVLGLAKVRDHFFIQGKALNRCRSLYRAKFEGTLD